jgi:peptidoglycan hydrolase-like protein with peptidoglycan-binding domain
MFSQRQWWMVAAAGVAAVTVPTTVYVTLTVMNAGAHTASAAVTPTSMVSPVPVTSPPSSTTTMAATTSAVRPTTTLAPTTTTTLPPTTLPPTTTLPPAPEPIAALDEPLAPVGSGRTGPKVVALQERLMALGFWTEDTDGKYGPVVVQAVMAAQKYYGLDPTGRADQATVDTLSGVTERPWGTIHEGDLFEVDKTRQLLFIIQGGRTAWVLNTSTGSDVPYTEVDQKNGGTTSGDAHTPEGTFKVYREYSDGWESGQLGELYRPKYFSGGVAVHGAPQVPNHPASHGCVRVSTDAMDWIWANDLLPKGLHVVVHV